MSELSHYIKLRSSLSGCNAKQFECDKYLDCDSCLEDKIKEHDKQIRTDTIDEFVHKVKEHHYVLSDVINSTDYGMFTVGIEQIADELKAGVKNEMQE